MGKCTDSACTPPSRGLHVLGIQNYSAFHRVMMWPALGHHSLRLNGCAIRAINKTISKKLFPSLKGFR